MLKHFLSDENGATAVEYTIIIFTVGVSLISVLIYTRESLEVPFQIVANTIAG